MPEVAPLLALVSALSSPVSDEQSATALAGINGQLRKIIKTRGHVPSDEAVTKLIWLALRNATADWGRAAHAWKAAMNQFAIMYEERFVRPPV